LFKTSLELLEQSTVVTAPANPCFEKKQLNFNPQTPFEIAE